MIKEKMLDYYQVHSVFSDPKQHTQLITNLPRNVNTLGKIVQGLMLHETDGALFNYLVTPARIKEISLRYVSRMLDRIVELDSSPLEQARAVDKKLIGTCRDFALMLVAMCRTVGIPARMRVGFATYTYKDMDFNPDHVLMEYWSQKEQRWISVDVRVSPTHIEKQAFDIHFDPYNVPHSEFQFAGDVWQRCRKNPALIDSYGYGKKKECTGLWYTRNKMMHDFSALLKKEMLPWDGWGYMYFVPPHQEIRSDKHLKSIDELALAIAGSDIDIDRLEQMQQKDLGLKLPSIITAYDRYGGPKSEEISVA